MSEIKSLVPKLRFPEFRDAGEWIPKPIDRICKSYSGGTPATTQNEFYGGDIPFIRSAEIGRENTELFLTPEGLSNSAAKLVAKGDVLVALYGANSGDVVLAKIDGAINQAILCLKSEGSNAYIYQYLSHIKNWIISTYIQGGQGNLSGEIVKSIELCFPTLAEQQKIADCLSSLDELITLEAQKLATLKTHKKGLMQQLFPAEGETLPQLRFPEFRDAGGWEEKVLGQVAKYENGKAHEQDIAESGDFVVVNSKFISTEGEVRKFTNAAFCIADKEDILMVLSDVPNGRAIAKCFLVDSDHLYTVNQRICKLTPYKAVSILLFYVLNRNSYFLAFDDGVKQTNLKKDDVLDCPVLLPKDLNEQQKIADCLTSLDDLITAQAQELDALKTHKKGLMQQIFPGMDAKAEVEA